MALPADTVWEVRASGADTNGGGRKSTASADLTLQDAAAYSVTDGVTAGTTTITSATANFGTDVVDHMVYVQGGTGSVSANWYHIVSRTNATTIVVDRSTGLTAGTGVTLKIGGAFASPGQAGAVKVAGNDVYIKAGTYTLSTSSANVSGGRVSDSTGGVDGSNVSRWVGYQSARGDNGTKPVISAGAVTSISVLSFTGSYTIVDNIEVDGNSGSLNNGFVLSITVGHAARLTARNCPGTGVNYTSASQFNIRNIYADTCGTGILTTGTSTSTLTPIFNSQTNACTTGFSGTLWSFCIAKGGTTGFSVASATERAVVLNCTAYGCSGNGFGGANANAAWAINSIAYGCGTYGFAHARSGFSETAYLVNCATGNNTSGSSNGYGNIEGLVTLSGDPFVNAASGNFALNSTAGAGAACRAAGIPGAFPGGTTTGYLDIGAVQHQDSGGGGGPLIGPGRLVRC